MSFWTNPTETKQRVVLSYGDNGPPPVVVEIEGGAVGFVPDEFDYAIRMPGGCGMAPAWVKTESPVADAAAEPTEAAPTPTFSRRGR